MPYYNWHPNMLTLIRVIFSNEDKYWSDLEIRRLVILACLLHCKGETLELKTGRPLVLSYHNCGY